MKKVEKEEKVKEEVSKVNVEKNKENKVYEIGIEEFENLMEDIESDGVIDYEELWDRVKGKVLSSKGLEKVVNELRGWEREFYYSERKRVFGKWRRKGRKILKKKLRVGNRKMNFYYFVE